jgi:uncharacterized membrane protein SpoIIM required for sporulation
MPSLPRSTEFRLRREPAWRELEELVARVEKQGVRALPAAALSRLPVLYRGALSALSVARSISLDRNLLAYLESLAGRAYLAVYGTRRHLRETLSDFVRWRFPATVRGFRWHLLAAAALLALGTAAGLLLTLSDMDRYYAFVSPEMAGGRTPTASTEALREALYGEQSTAGMLTTFAMFLFTNNAKVGMLAFAVGFAAGLPAALLLFANGLTLGAFAALYHSRGLSLELWAWLLPHGVTELSAVVLCGAGGLALAERLAFPGAAGRLAGLAEQGRRAGTMVLGAVGMFFLAGLVEGIFRQQVHSVPARWAVAGGSALLWAAYFLLAGRGRR